MSNLTNEDIFKINEWIRYSNMDLEAAELLNEKYKKPYEIICYHCQQSVEKALKASLLFYGYSIYKSHDLLELAEDCQKRNADYKKIEKACSQLSDYAFEARYPFHVFDITEVEIEKALKNAFSCRKLVMKVLDEIIYEKNKSLDIDEDVLKKWEEQIEDASEKDEENKKEDRNMEEEKQIEILEKLFLKAGARVDAHAIWEEIFADICANGRLDGNHSIELKMKDEEGKHAFVGIELKTDYNEEEDYYSYHITITDLLYGRVIYPEEVTEKDSEETTDDEPEI